MEMDSVSQVQILDKAVYINPLRKGLLYLSLRIGQTRFFNVKEKEKTKSKPAVLCLKIVSQFAYGNYQSFFRS